MSARRELEWLVELWRMDPSPEELMRLYREARRAVPYFHGRDHDIVVAKQPWLRKVSDEFGRRLAAAGVYVEGETS